MWYIGPLALCTTLTVMRVSYRPPSGNAGLEAGLEAGYGRLCGSRL